MRWSANLIGRLRRLPPDPPGFEGELEAALRGAHPQIEPPAGLAERIQRAALASAPARPVVAPRRRPLLLPAGVAAALLLGALFWHAPTIRAHQIAASMRDAWKSVRDYHGEAVCRVPLFGRAGDFRVRIWYRRPAEARADVVGGSLHGVSLKGDLLVSRGEARIRIPALATDVLVPLKGDFAFLRDATEVGRSLRRLEAMRELRAAGSGTVAGQECYVLQYQTRSILERLRDRLGLGPKEREEVSRVAASGKVWVARETLLPMKIETYDPDGATLATAQFERVAINQGVDDKVFAMPPAKKAERLPAATFEELLKAAVQDLGDVAREWVR